MTFASFFEVYEADKRQRVKESTWESKSHVIRTKILPYFGNRKIAEIEAKDIIAWQNELMAYRDEKGKPYSDTVSACWWFITLANWNPRTALI